MRKPKGLVTCDIKDALQAHFTGAKMSELIEAAAAYDFYVDYYALVRAFERELMLTAYRHFDKNKTHASSSLNMNRTTFFERSVRVMGKDYDLDV